MGRRSRFAANGMVWSVLAVAAGVALLPMRVRAQDARAVVQQAVRAELDANANDHSHWRYVETEEDGSKFVVVETEYGAMKRHLEEHGQPASAAVLRADDAANERFAHDPELQEKQRQGGLHDDKSAAELTKEMPDAFVWKVEHETADEIALSYRPNPNYRPPDMESRVMGQMAGTMVVSKPGHRIKTFKGTLSQDIAIGWGLLARIKAGGTFDVERRQVGPGLWCITQTHVHITGHAIFFKTIGQQEDEVKTDFVQVPAGTTLEQALGMLKETPATAVSKNACCRR